MPMLPVRDLGGLGVIKDGAPYDIPPNALSNARNVRFRYNRIERSPIFTLLYETSLSTPTFCATITDENNADQLLIAYADGSVSHNVTASQTDVTPAAWSANSSSSPYTFCTLQGLHYINREDHVPWVFDPNINEYKDLPNWDSNHRCVVLRKYKDFLLALNVSKSGSRYPTMIKWSDIAQYGTEPSSWDPSDLTKSAGENTPGDMRSPILDGWPLRDSFAIYTADQIWMMDYTAGQEVFTLEKSADNKGIINTNCVTEVDGVHFVFGLSDIYVFDGVSTPRSIIDGRNRRFLYRYLNRSKLKVCFVAHMPSQQEVWFCYNDISGDETFSGTDYCNAAAVYNYSADTWTFVDLPNTGMITDVALDASITYDGIGSVTYAGTTSSYSDLETGAKKSTYCVSAISGADITADRALLLEDAEGGGFGYPVVDECNGISFAERVGMDLDETGEELRAYKMIKSIYPQAQVEDAEMYFSFGSTDYPHEGVAFETPQSFDPRSQYKVDTKQSGRYLSWRVTYDGTTNFKLTGFDMDAVATGRR